jgi:O-antigen ligase
MAQTQVTPMGESRLFVALAGTVLGAATLILLVAQPQPLLALVPALALPTLFVLGRWPQVGFYLMMCMIPLDAWGGLSEEYRALTISKFVGAWLLVVIGFRLVMDSTQLERLRTRMWYPLVGYFLVAFYASAASDYFPPAMDQLRRVLTAYLFTGFTLFLVDEKQFKKTLPFFVIASTSVSAFFGIVGYHLQIPSLMLNVASGGIEARAVGATNDPNFFAAMVLSGLPFIVHYFFAHRSWLVKALMAFLFLHNSYAITITYSRAATLVYVVTLMILLAEQAWKLRPQRLGFVVIVVGIVVVLMATQLTDTTLWQRMKTLTTPQVDYSLMRRKSYIFVAWDSFKKHPIAGAGQSIFPMIYKNSNYAAVLGTEETGYARLAHNTYLEVLVGTGIIGTAFFLWALGMAFKLLYQAQARLRKSRPEEAAYVRTAGYSFLSFMMSLIFLSAFYHKYIWLFLGLAVVADRLTKPKEPTG